MLPDEIPLSQGVAERLSSYIEGGGALLASHRSGLDPDGVDFALKELGVKLVGEAPYSPDFLVPGAVGAGLPTTEHVMYRRGLQVETGRGTEVLSQIAVPYFNRTYEHFCSHNHTPSSGETGYPGITQKGRCIYFSHPVFTQYAERAPRWCKTFVLDALERLLPEPLVHLRAPSTALAVLSEQVAENRQVLHLLHYIPERRGQFDVIEDIIPLHDVGVSVRVHGEVRAVTCVPEGDPLEFTLAGERVEFVLPRLEGHQMVCLDLA
ncbi:hypothetical protein ACFL6X_09645 [Candidatus Latescibacterota bacterium]